MSSRLEVAMITPSHPLALKLRDAIESRTGIFFQDDRCEELVSVAETVAEELSLGTVENVVHALHGDGFEGERCLDGIARRITTGETYFFRIRSQFDALRAFVLPEILERNRKRRELRIWSAGCSSGEEAYSIAIAVSEVMHDLPDWEVQILATDIDSGA